MCRKARRNLNSLGLNTRQLIFEQSLICLSNLQRGCRHKKFELNEESLKKGSFSQTFAVRYCPSHTVHSANAYNGLKPFLKDYSLILQRPKIHKTIHVLKVWKYKKYRKKIGNKHGNLYEIWSLKLVFIRSLAAHLRVAIIR